MERKKLLYWGIQFTGWTAYFLFSIALLYSLENIELTFYLFVYATVIILSFIFVSHGIRYVILKQILDTKKIGRLILLAIILSIAGAFIIELFDFFVITKYLPIDFYAGHHEDGESIEIEFKWAEMLYTVSRTTTLFLLWTGFYYAFLILEKSRAQEILNLKWEASKNEIELKNLRTQLNPHFLFNSLNSIRALIGLNPEQAKVSVTQLSNLLRRSINLGKMKVIPLKEEIGLVQIYLDLEQVRFEERLNTQFDIGEETLSCKIPPLLIQTIVENAVKHGISKSIEGGLIRLSTRKVNDELKIIVANSGNLDIDDEQTGIGIANSKRRLGILFGDNASFSMEQIKDEVVVKINIIYE